MPKWTDALDSNGVCGRIVSHRSKDFRQDYGRLAELRSLVRPGTPFMACTAIASGPFRTGTLSLECLAKSLKDLMSKTAFSRANRRVRYILHDCMERSHLRHPQILQEECEFWIHTVVSFHLY